MDEQIDLMLTLFPASVQGCDGQSEAALTEKCPHPDLYLWRIRVSLWTGQECCDETMPNIPVHSDMGESLEREVCECVVCVYNPLVFL